MSHREEIKILWEGPFTTEDIINGNINNEKYDVQSSSVGLYQVYGVHPLYGNDVLVYIGRTKGRNGFKSRLKGRWVTEYGSDNENVKIYLGTIFTDGKKIHDENILIDKAEVLLIHTMKPAYNSSNIQRANRDFVNQKYIIHNEGNYKNLYPVLDSKYFWHAYKNFAIINELASSYKIKKVDDEDHYYGFILNNDTQEKDKYEIWFCVDYEIWNKNKIPFMIQIRSDDKKIIKKLKKIKEFQTYNCEDDVSEEIYYYDVGNEFLDLDKYERKETSDDNVKYIKQLISN